MGVVRPLGRRTPRVTPTALSSLKSNKAALPPNTVAVQLVQARYATTPTYYDINEYISGKRALASYRHSAAFQEPDQHKEKVVILGSGWGGYTFSREVDPKQYSPVVISPRTYFVFTPLLTDAAGGSVDFSNITEPIRDRRCKADYIQAAARAIDFKRKTILCESAVVKKSVTETPREALQEKTSEESQHRALVPEVDKYKWERGDLFEVPYDKLVISVGAVARTFNTPGVRENAMFFKDVGDARKVKRRVRECFELAALPTTSPELREWLLHFAIVGAGPTGTELAGSLRDYIYGDMIKIYPSLAGLPHITLYDVAPKVLSMFDESLSKYAVDTMRKEGVSIKTSHHVELLRWGQPGAPGPYEMDPKRCLTLKTKEEGEVGVGMCVWATGNAQRKLVRDMLEHVDTFPAESALMKDGHLPPVEASKANWHVKKSPRGGALLIDDHLRVQLENDKGETAVLQDVYAIGDNAVAEKNPFPATAQATRQEAKWLGQRFNERDIDRSDPFAFHNMGTLAYIGGQQALMQFPSENGQGQRASVLPTGIKGRAAWMVWNSAYIGMSVSWKNKIRIIARWALNRLFGREMSRFD